MSKHTDSLGNRMKQYENCYRLYLPKRSAVCIRIDGKAFHSYTKGFARPYDEIFAKAMQKTALKLAENISSCKFAFQQSDEISLILTDYENINTEPWFGNNLQKLVSVSASMATFYFQDAFYDELRWESLMMNDDNDKETNLNKKHWDAFEKPALFDSRVFILPREEVFNYIYWRQMDTIRNSIQLTGQAYFSHNQLQGKNCDEIQEMLWQEHNVNWSEQPNWFKNGVSIYKNPVMIDNPNNDLPTLRYKWKIDTETPIFTQDRNYINKHINFKE